MALKIETFSSLKGGNSFYKAVTHPEAADKAASLIDALERAESVALYDPLGFLDGFAACHDLSSVAITGLYVQAVTDIGKRRLGWTAQTITGLPTSGASLVFIVAFDADRLAQQIAHLLPDGASVISLDAMRLDPSLLTNARHYLDPLNFATNFAFFRNEGSLKTCLTTANYWSNYGSADPALSLTLFDAAGQILARWRETMPAAGVPLSIDSAAIAERFQLGDFVGQLFIHVIGAAGHDVVKYALDTIDTAGLSLSCTHDANAWPADFYAGLPAPRDDETVILWVQNSLPIPIPAGEIRLNLMGDDHVVPLQQEIAPFASVALDIAQLLPAARWPQQIEITTGRYVVRPRYEVIRGTRRRIAHPNVERIDLKPTSELAELAPWLGKGFILPAPILPLGRWQSIVLPTPMATTQLVLPIAATAYDSSGRTIGSHRFGRLARRDSVALDLDQLAGALNGDAFGHVELTYDWTAGTEADGWLHALFRYEDRLSGHAAESSFGAHIFNTPVTWRDEPQSYTGRPPGLTTRLFLRLGGPEMDTLCHLIYPASTPWHAHSATDLILNDSTGQEIARTRVEIACGGSFFWRVGSLFDRKTVENARGGSLIVRDSTCRLFGYHGLDTDDGRFSLDHMFGF